MARNSIILIFTLVLAGCAPKVVGIYNDSAFSKNQKTFIVRNPKGEKSLSSENKVLDDRLNAIITTNLENKGLKTSSLPDLYVSYMASVYSTTETTTNNYNYNNPYYRGNYMYQNPFDYSSTSYKTGVFIINIKNSQNKLVWQGSKTFKLKSKQSVQASLPEICQEVINAFDINYSK